MIIGAGLSGLASAIHLARGGMAVTLLEPETVMPPIVGESLDWSAPGLLAGLGIPVDELIASRAANWNALCCCSVTASSANRFRVGGTRQPSQPPPDVQEMSEAVGGNAAASSARLNCT